MISQDDKELLAQIIVYNIQEEFMLKHLSGNLVDSIRIESEGDAVRVIVDAPVYDMGEYLKKGVIVHSGKGSYAASVNEQGGQVLNKRTGNHKGYVDKAIMEAIVTWKELMKKQIDLKQWGNVEYATRTEL